jgi:hypothetical protein
MKIKRRITTTIAILGTGSLILIGGIAIPSMSRTSHLTDRIALERAKIQQRYELRNYVKDSHNDIRETKARLATIKKVAIHEGAELEFVQAVETAASTAGVNVTLNLATANQKNISPWEKWVPVQMAVRGAFPKVISFLNEVEHLPYYVIFESLLVNSPRSASGGDVDAVFSGRAYWQGKNVPEVLKDEDARE